MELLLIILNKEEYFERLTWILTECGVSGATIMDSEGLGHFLAYEVPIFAGLRQFVGERKTANRIILAILGDKSIFPKIKKLLAEEEIDFSKPGTGIITRLPVNEVIKSDEELG
ncbi:MAG: hypothetical protein DRP85_02480 [Candidatus Makaraimicrobium thalassicum]|nr:MAG: hypothetical protein DRP85_02480 [Candidatus Omnitrophota bacterium]